MDVNDQTAYWDRVARQKTFTHPVNLSFLERYLDKDGLIIDYGCGYGRVVRQLADASYTNVRGYDTSQALIDRGRESGVENIYHITGWSQLPVADHTADCILLFAVLTCIPANAAQQALITALQAKLKTGGILYISDYYLQHDPAEAGGYECLNGDPQNNGVFTLPEGATFRHHATDWIATLLRGFAVKEHVLIPVSTMNGHAAEAFQLIAVKGVNF